MAERLKGIGTHITRYGLVIVLLWIGGMKFTAYEAEGIKPLVANSPLMGSVYRVMSVGGFSSLLGVVEIAIGVLIALRPVWPMGYRFITCVPKHNSATPKYICYYFSTEEGLEVRVHGSRVTFVQKRTGCGGM
jgi:hypothetical protein